MSATWGLVAEYASPEALIAAARVVRDAGYAKWDAHSPFPVHGLDDAMGVKPTVLPWLVLGAGLTGCAAGFLLPYWTNAVDYKMIIGGKPFNSFPATVPIMFEVTVLFASLTAFFAMMALNRLPELAHPLFKSAAFRRATNDGFFISVEAADPRFDLASTEALLVKAGARRVERIEG